MPNNSDGIPQPSTTPTKAYKDNYESIFGAKPKRIESGTYALVGGELVCVSGSHGVERSSRSAISSKNPLRSEALSVAPHQAAEFAAAAKRNGTGAVYDKDGDCFLSSDGVRNREMQAQGRYDKDAGYGQYGGK